MSGDAYWLTTIYIQKSRTSNLHVCIFQKSARKPVQWKSQPYTTFSTNHKTSMKFWMSYWVHWEVKNILSMMHPISFISLCMAKIYVVYKCKNYLKIPMTGLFAWHVSIHDFGRYQFHQWNVLFQKTIWNIYHHWNQAWFGLAAYFCCHAFPWLILKKEIFQKAFHAAKAKKYFFVIFLVIESIHYYFLKLSYLCLYCVQIVHCEIYSTK